MFCLIKMRMHRMMLKVQNNRWITSKSKIVLLKRIKEDHFYYIVYAEPNK